MTNWITALSILLACLVLAGCARHHNDLGLDPTLPDNGYRELTEERFSPPDWPQALFADVYIPDGERAAWPARRPVQEPSGKEEKDRRSIAAALAVLIEGRFSGTHSKV